MIREVTALALSVWVGCSAPQPQTALPSETGRPVAARPEAPPTHRPEDAHTPVMVRGRAIDPWTGVEVALLVAKPARLGLAVPHPPGAHEYQVGDDLVDVSTRSVTSTASSISFDGDERLVRRRPDGSNLWSSSLSGSVGSVRPPDLLVEGERVFVAGYDKGPFIAALSAEGGGQLWRVPSVADRLFAQAGVLMSTDCSGREAPDQRWLIGRRMASGEELWRIELPLFADPEPLHPEGDLARVQARSFDDAMAYVFDPHGGNLVRKLDEDVLGALPLGGSPSGSATLYATERRLVRYQGDEVKWELPPIRRGLTDAGFAATPRASEYIVYAFGAIHDSGVQLLRVDVDAGKVLWVAEAAPLGVDHSKYFHVAYARVFGDYVAVVSQAAFGDFVEVRDLATGDLLQRHLL